VSQYVERALRYCRAVCSGEQPACRYIKLTSEGFLRDHAAAVAGTGPWGFSSGLVDDACGFAETLPHIKGPCTGRLIALLDWQCLLFAAIFGFVERGSNVRRYRQAVVFVPRGNGKTTIAATIALYATFASGEGGAEGYAAATTRDQARILFDAARHMLRDAPQVARDLDVEVGINAISSRTTASRLKPVSSDAKTLDGLSVQVAVLDEIASHKTREVYDALLTAMGKRRQPLLISISTATGNTSGVGKLLFDYSVAILEGTKEDDRVFALLYGVDPEDDLWDEATWRKASPSWGTSVIPDAVRSIMKQARNDASQESSARTRLLNMWIGSDDALFSMRDWNACADTSLELSQFEGQPCHIGVDLASRIDLTSMVIVFMKEVIEGEDRKLHYTVFARCYLNEAAVMEARNASYPGWAASGDLRITEGNETDFNVIEHDILDICRSHQVLSVATDRWQAVMLSQRVKAQNVNVIDFPMTAQAMSDPTKELGAAIRAGRLRHDGNGPLGWCISNVVGHEDTKGNVYPRKARPDNKIDAAVALIVGIARAMVQPSEYTSIYDDKKQRPDGFLFV